MHNLFLIIALIFGISFVFITPLFTVPDEFTHFARSIQVSNGHLLPEKDEFGAGVTLNKDEFKFIQNKGRLSDTYIVKDLGNKVFVNLPVVQSPVQYLPQASGLLLARILNLSPIESAYLARIVTFLIWLILTYFAIKLVPFGKWFFFTLALLPMTIYQAASVSPDGILFGLAATTVAYFLHLYFSSGVVSRNQFIKILILIIVFSLFKLPYFLITLVFLLLPIRKFKDQRTFFLYLITVFTVPFLFAAIWFLLTKNLLNQNNLSTPENFRIVSPSEQTYFIISNPINYTKILIRSYLVNAGFYQESFIGLLGPLTIRLNAWALSGYTILLALSLFAGDYIEGIGKKTRLLVVLLLAGLFIAIPSILYLIWTPVKGTIIEGVQGRYFIPLAFLFPIVFSGLLYKKIEINQRVFKIVFGAMLTLMLLVALLRVFHSYYLISTFSISGLFK